MTVTDANDNTISGEPVTLATDGGQQISAVTDHGDGTYTATVTATTTAGNSQLTATDGSLSGGATLTQVPGAPASVVVNLDPASITADGSSHTTATVTVEDAHGNRRTGDPLTVKSSGDQDVGAVTDHGGGKYTTTITSTTKAGTYTITATDGSKSGAATLTQTPGPVASVALDLSPDTLVADGATKSTAKVTVEDVNGNRVTGDPVKLTTDGGQEIGAVSDNGDGTYTADVTSTKKAGTSELTAADGSVTDVKTLTQVHGPVASVALNLSPDSLVADGASKTTAKVTVTDANGNTISGESVKLTTDGGQGIGAVSDNGDGSYTAEVTSTKTAGKSKLTATDGSVTGDATLTQTPGPVASVALKLEPASITADGNSHTTAKATVEDVNGNRVTGDPVKLTTDGGQTIGTITDNGDGTYTADVTSTKTAGTSKLTATDGSVTDDATLTQVPGPAASVALKLDPASITADGNSHTTAKATVEDVNGNRDGRRPREADDRRRPDHRHDH